METLTTKNVTSWPLKQWNQGLLSFLMKDMLQHLKKHPSRFPFLTGSLPSINNNADNNLLNNKTHLSSPFLTI